MSKISDIYDQIQGLVETALPDYCKLPNSINLANNPAILMQDDGYAIGFGPSENTLRPICPKVSIQRDFDIILVNRITAHYTDDTKIAQLEKDLFEDQLSIIKALDIEAEVNGVHIKSTFIGDSGIEFLDNEDEQYLLVLTTFQVEYFENLT